MRLSRGSKVMANVRSFVIDRHTGLTLDDFAKLRLPFQGHKMMEKKDSKYTCSYCIHVRSILHVHLEQRFLKITFL